MQVSQILEAKTIGKGKFAGYSYDSNTNKLQYPDGKTVNVANAKDAQRLSQEHLAAKKANTPKSKKTYSNPNTATGKIPKTNKKDFDIKSSKGKITVKIKGGATYSGSAKEVLQQMDKAGDAGAKRGLARIGKNANKYAKWAERTLKGASYLGMGYVAYDAVTNWAAERAAIRSVFKNTIFAGSELDANHPVYKELISYHTKSTAVAVGSAVASEMVQLIAAGKAIKFLRYARALQVGLAATGWGAIIAVLIWAITEGSMWLISWWAKKYGPEWFQATAIEDLNIDGDIVPSPKAPKVDNSEVKSEVEKAANDSGDKVQDPTEVFRNFGKVQSGKKDITTDFEF